jgi:U3 small nucleolar RNA-associated protein 11
MPSSQLDVQKRQHRERGQPLKRQKRYGLLEKHKDYVQRARDYHSKQDRLKLLRTKAELRNKDEFYFGMVRSRTNKGVHIQSRGNEALPNDVVKLLKTQDVKYVQAQRAAEKKVRRRFLPEPRELTIPTAHRAATGPARLARRR